MSIHPFYVYILFDWLGVPRWVGKGKGKRDLSHERGSSTNWMKDAFIEQTWIMLEEIPKIRVREGLTEDEAFETEIALIAAIGRFPNGPLTNMTDGGEGPSGLIHTEAAKQKISIGLRGKPKTIEHNLAVSRAVKGVPKPSAKWPWITNGTSNRKLRPNENLPDNWKYGKAQSQKALDGFQRRKSRKPTPTMLAAWEQRKQRGPTAATKAANDRKRGKITPAMEAANARQRGRAYFTPAQIATLKNRRNQQLTRAQLDGLLIAAKRPKTQEHRDNISAATMGRIPWNKGKKCT